MYGKDATVSAVHAGLECSAIGAKYPDMDMISLGPTLQNVHSPDEALQVSSVAKVMDLLAETLKQMPDK